MKGAGGGGHGSTNGYKLFNGSALGDWHALCNHDKVKVQVRSCVAGSMAVRIAYYIIIIPTKSTAAGVFNSNNY